MKEKERVERPTGGIYVSTHGYRRGAFGIIGLFVAGAGLIILYNEYCDNK